MGHESDDGYAREGRWLELAFDSKGLHLIPVEDAWIEANAKHRWHVRTDHEFGLSCSCCPQVASSSLAGFRTHIRHRPFPKGE